MLWHVCMLSVGLTLHWVKQYPTNVCHWMHKKKWYDIRIQHDIGNISFGTANIRLILSYLVNLNLVFVS